MMGIGAVLASASINKTEIRIFLFILQRSTNHNGILSKPIDDEGFAKPAFYAGTVAGGGTKRRSNSIKFLAWESIGSVNSATGT